MVRQLDSHCSEVLPRGGCGTRVPRAPALALARRTPATADQDPPVFALLRTSLGLPLDDPRWWPPCPVGELPAPAVSFAAPTIGLLEHTLAGLRAWGTAPGAQRHRPA